MKRLQASAIIKFLLLLLVLSAVLLCGIVALPQMQRASAEGTGTYGNASISKGGNVSLELTVDKSALEESVKDAESFALYVKSIVKNVNGSSQDADMVTLKKIKDNGSHYTVNISTRRINSNLKGMGDYAWSKLSTFTAPESDTYTRLALMARGNLRCMLMKPFNGIVGSVEIEAGTNKNQVYIKPVDAATGEEISVEAFSEAGQAASSKTYFTMFRIPDVKSISKIKVNLPGNIKFISSECVNVIDNNTVELVPVTLAANIVRSEYVYDEEGNFIYDEAGVELTKPIFERDKEISCIFGYLAYEHSPNYVMIGLLSLLGAGIVALVVVGFVKGSFAKFFGIERKKKAAKSGDAVPEGTPASVAGEVAVASVQFQSVALQNLAQSAGTEAAVAAAPALTDADVAAQKAAEKLRRKNLRAKSPFAKIAKHKLLYMMLLPSFILVILFSYIPMLGVVIAFKDYNLIDGFVGSEWVGLKYFKYIFSGQDPAIFLVFRNTIYISLIRIATNFPAILIFALMINEIKSDRLKGLTRTISYLPSFISWIAVGGMMVALFSVDEGALNTILTRLLGKTVKINWYAENKYWWMILALSSMWKSLGWGTIVYMSALGCINSELYDACRIDGGGRFRMILSVTLPGIMNVIMLQLIMDASNLVRDNYEQILAMTQGSTMLSESTYVVGAMAYSSIMGGSGFSQATAFSLIQGAIGLVLVLLTNKIAKKTDNEGVM